MAGIAEDWKRYTIRDRILLCSSILPLFISVLYMLYYLPILGNLIFSGEGGLGLGKYLFYNWETGERKLFSTYDPETYTQHIIRPIWLLLSFLSLGLYGFVLSKSDEEVTELLKQKPETAENGSPTALSRTSIFMAVTAVSQLLILFCLFIIGSFTYYGWVSLENYFYFWDSPFVLFKGYIYSDYATVNPLSYLYIPNLIATVALAYYTRIKNAEENEGHIEREDKALAVADTETDYGGQSPVVQSHVFLLVTALGGMFGLDKAYRGDYLLAILKFITLGGLWIWQLYDLYVAAGIAGKSWVAEKLRTGRITEAHITLWIAASPLGFIGVDRAYKGDALSGVFKMLTLGGLGLWWLADAYVAAKKAGSAW